MVCARGFIFLQICTILHVCHVSPYHQQIRNDHTWLQRSSTYFSSGDQISLPKSYGSFFGHCNCNLLGCMNMVILITVREILVIVVNYWSSTYFSSGAQISLPKSCVSFFGDCNCNLLGWRMNMGILIMVRAILVIVVNYWSWVDQINRIDKWDLPLPSKEIPQYLPEKSLGRYDFPLEAGSLRQHGLLVKIRCARHVASLFHMDEVSLELIFGLHRRRCSITYLYGPNFFYSPNILDLVQVHFDDLVSGGAGFQFRRE